MSANVLSPTGNNLLILGVPRGPKLKQYRVAGIAISLRLQKIDFEYNDIDTYTVMFLNSKTSASDNPRQYGTTQNYTSADDQLKCKLWDNVICFEDVVLPEPFPLADINDIIIKVRTITPLPLLDQYSVLLLMERSSPGMNELYHILSTGHWV